MLIDTMLDLAGLEYDAVDRRMTLQPVLPGQLAPDRDLANVSLRQRDLPARAADRRQRPSAAGRGRPQRPGHAPDPCHLPGADRTGSLAWHARPRPRTRLRRRHRPARLERQAALRRVGVDLDLGMRGQSRRIGRGKVMRPHMPSGGGIARNSCSRSRQPRPSSRRKPESPQAATQDDAFFQVVAEQAVADAQTESGGGRQGPSAQGDSSGHILRVGHLDDK